MKALDLPDVCMHHSIIGSVVIGLHTNCNVCVGADLTTVDISRKAEPAADGYLIFISGLSVVTIVILMVIIIAMMVVLKKYLINNHLH